MKRFPTLLLAACALGALALSISAQARIRIVGGPQPARPAVEDEKIVPADDPNAVKPVDPTPEEHDRIAELIEQLGDAHLVVRDRAMSELAGFEARALGQVREAKGHDDDEIANRCGLLEEVIMSRQGELFLAARRLNLSIDELNLHLNNSDVTQLLTILKSRAQAGMVPLWARVMARLAARPQLYPTAQLCREIEGNTGYGEALAKAARAPEAAPYARNLLLLMALLPPGDPADTVEALTQMRFSIGTGRGIEETLSATPDFRGVYDAEKSLAAVTGRPDPNKEDPEGAAEVRTALALSLTGTCTEQQLNAAELPALKEMSPLILNAWLGLLQRSGLNARIEGALNDLLKEGADTRRISIAAGAYTNITPVADVVARFGDLPFEAQLSVLDNWWLNPRDAATTQAFLITLLKHDQPGIRRAAAMSLGQYRAASTVTALLGAINDTEAGPRALESLVGMSDMLDASQLETLANALPEAGLLARPLIAEILVRSNHQKGLEPLIAAWREVLPRNELPLAWLVFANQPETPIGAIASARLSQRDDSWAQRHLFLINLLSNADLELTRALFELDDAQGFALIEDIARDENDPMRLEAMKALAMAGRDAAFIDNWLKGMTGEVKDPLGGNIGEAVALSNTQQADDWRRTALQQGVGAANLRWVYQGVIAGRGSVTRAELVEVLFSTPESARNWSGNWELLQGPLSDKASRNLATGLMFSDNSNLINQPGLALLLRDAGVDLLAALYGDAEKPTPRDGTQIYTTAVLGDETRATEIIKRTEFKEDGSNFASLTIARAWLGLLEGDENRRLKLGVSMNPTNLFGALRHREQAAGGNAPALYTLLDTFGPDAIRFKRGQTAEARLVDQRWGSPYMDVQGVAESAYHPGGTPPELAGAQIAMLFEQPPPEEWRNWWSSRRGLVEWNAETAKFKFTELP